MRLFGLVAALALCACGGVFSRPDAGTSAPRCSAANCSGCCSNGVCMTGTANAVCGKQGGSCEDCGDGTCASGVCKPTDTTLPSVEGSCEAAPRLTLDAGYLSIEGDTTRRVSHETGQCGGANESDVAFAVALPVGQKVRAKVTPLEANFQPVVYAQSFCSGGGYLYGCGAAASQGQAAEISFSSSNNPTYVFVDGADGTSGQFRLEIVSLGEACAAPLQLTDTAQAQGSTFGRVNDSVGTCGGRGPDLVTELPVTVRSNLLARLSTNTVRSIPVLYLQRSCGGEELGCAVGSLSGDAKLSLPDLEPGTYYLWSDDDGVEGGIGQLTIDLTPEPAADSCTTAKALSFSNGADGGVAHETAGGPNYVANEPPSCGYGNAADAVYSFTTTRLMDFTATGENGYGLALRGPTCTGAEVACATGSLHVSALPAGTYYLVAQVPGYGTALDVVLSDPRPGDTCSTPRLLPFTGGADGGDAFVQANLTGASNDATGLCGGYGPDEVYQFSTASVLDLRVSLTTQAFSPSLSLRTACDQGELACTPGVSPAVGELEYGSLSPGTYWLWVDSSSSSSGLYNLSASLTPPVQGDGCTAPTDVTLPSDGGVFSDSRDNTQLFNNAAGTCGGSGSPDSVYRFTLPAPATVTASVTGSSSLRPVVYLRSACDSGELACSAASALGGTSTVTAALGSGTYFLWVDGLGSSSGSYALQLSAQ